MMPEGFEIEFTPVSDRPADIAPEEAARYLSPDEEASYRALKAPKRRREWLAGRLSAKILLARKLAETGHRVAPPDILIEAGEGGAPSWRTRRPLDPPPPAWPISISHSGNWAACALFFPETRLGIDMEKVETRDPAWVEVAFHPEELPGGEEADPAALTRLWTGKEAVLKLLALGLSVDLWDVRLGPGPEPRVRLFDKALERHRELGSPEIRVCTMDVPQHVLSVAYTPARGGPGEGGGAHGPVG